MTGSLSEYNPSLFVVPLHSTKTCDRNNVFAHHHLNLMLQIECSKRDHQICLHIVKGMIFTQTVTNLEKSLEKEQY